MDWTLRIKEFLSNEIDDFDSVLDIGCGNKTYSKYGMCITIDAWDKVNPDILFDIEKNDLQFPDKSFDYILLLDVIEHLEKERGKEVLEQCFRVAKKVILFTPLYWTDNHDNTNDPDCWAYGNKFNIHKSLWTLDDFKDWQIIEKEDSILCMK